MRSVLTIESFIPPAFDAYRPLIVETFDHFLDRLPPHRQAGILHAQQELAASSSAEQRLVACLQCCPTLHKLGQILARDKRLAPELRNELQQLEVLASQTPLREIEPFVNRALGDAIREFDIDLEPHALAEGSVAIAWPITWKRPDDSSPNRAILKIPRPAIRQRVAEELDVLSEIANLVESNCDRYGLPAFACRETFDDVRQLLLNEIDFQREQVHLAAAARQYAEDAFVTIPALLPFSTTEVTAMSRLDGTKITHLNTTSAADRSRLAERICGGLLAHVMFARDSDVLLHGDPHAGNMLRMHGDAIGLIDWSLAGTLSDSQRGALMQLVVAGMLLDGPMLARSLASLAVRTPDESVVRAVAGEALAEIGVGSPAGISWLTRTLDRAAIAGVQFPDSALLFRKALHTLFGVLADVSPETSVDSLMWSQGLAAFANDLPARSFALPTDERFAVRLSNAELIQACWSAPLAPWRYWQQAMARAAASADRDAPR
ncbi:MAG: hypothetical protein H6819_06090 [Phycisphaerales bacterium]|nr:hypothetical protein [Phycisphaerales bacterium]MCB9858608.1 hypothetical protein [Phycisphaerales bacterium]